jgi:hypothetical protein
VLHDTERDVADPDLALPDEQALLTALEKDTFWAVRGSAALPRHASHSHRARPR